MQEIVEPCWERKMRQLVGKPPQNFMLTVLRFDWSDYYGPARSSEDENVFFGFRDTDSLALN